MAKLLVGTTARMIPSKGGRGRLLMQNLGPGNVWFDSDAPVTTDTGLLLPVGVIYESPMSTQDETRVSLISDTAGTDVRWTVVGSA